jgi:hypothetical protein
MKCCKGNHPWDEHEVPVRWAPPVLHCLIVGENPGDVGSRYFYSDPFDPDRVIVRKNLLAGLHSAGILATPTLDAFRSAGFIFDHAIRCRLPSEVINRERQLAMRYASPRAAAAEHLRPLIDRAETVWAMGYIARNAVANLFPEIARIRNRIGGSPYPCHLPEAPKIFVSRYFTRISEEVASSICEVFAASGDAKK